MSLPRGRVPGRAGGPVPCDGDCPASRSSTGLVRAESDRVTRRDGDGSRIGLSIWGETVRDSRREMPVRSVCRPMGRTGARLRRAISRMPVATAAALLVESCGAAGSAIHLVPRRCNRLGRANRSGCTNNIHHYVHRHDLRSSSAARGDSDCRHTHDAGIVRRSPSTMP